MSDLEKKIDVVISREKQRPRTIEETVELYRTESEKLISGGNYIKTPSGLLVNAQNNACKGHCMKDKGIPIVCGKLDFCNNFKHAATILLEIDFHEFKKSIDDIY